MPILLNFLLLLVELWLVGGFVLLLHRLNPRLGLAPLMIFLGGLTAILQLPAAHQVGALSNFIPLEIDILLPVVLLGLLIIYIVDGTADFQRTLIGLILVSILAALIEFLPQGQPDPGFLQPVFVRVFSLFVEALILALVYPWISNRRNSYPDFLAASLALFCGLWVDAFVSSVFLIDSGSASFLLILAGQLAGKSLAGLFLLPLLYYDLHRIAPFIPMAAAAGPRPALDIFNAKFEIESRARRHADLLRTLTQIQQVIAQTTGARELLANACRLLVAARQYSLAWIGLEDPEGDKMQVGARAGLEIDLTGLLQSARRSGAQDQNLLAAALHNNRAVVLKDTRQSSAYATSLSAAVRGEFRSIAVFPMRHAGRVAGLLNLYSQRANSYESEELDLLQQLADDLAYALNGIESRNKQDILQAAAENIQNGLLVADLQGKIRYANPAAAKMFSHPPGELAGRNIKELPGSPEEKKSIENQLQKLLKEGRLVTEFQGPAQEGGSFYASLRANLVYDRRGQPTQMVISLEDITRRRQDEEQIITRNARLHQSEHRQRELSEALAQVAVALNSSLKLDDVLDRILEQTLRVAVCKSANIMLCQDGMAVLARRMGYASPKEPNARLDDIRFPLSLPTFHTMMTTARPILIGDTRQDPRWTDMPGTKRIRSYAGAPLMVGDQVIGFLNIESDQPDFFPEDVVQRLQAFAANAAIALQNARLYQESRQQAEELNTLVEAAAAVSSSLDVGQVLQVVAAEMVRLLKMDGCAISNYNPVGNTITLLINYPSKLFDLDLEWYLPINLLEFPLIREVLEKSKPAQIHLDNIGVDIAERKLMLKNKAKSLLVFPLIAQEQTIGLAEIFSRDDNHLFSQREIDLAQTLGFQGATAIQNARMFQRTRRHTTELEERVLDRTAELRAAMERIEGILASVRDAVFVLDESGNLIKKNQAGDLLLEAARQQKLDLFSIDTLEQLANEELPSDKTIFEVQGRAYQPLASHLSLEGKPAGQVLVFRDVTWFRELDKMKTKFVSDVSHELRTPLTNLTIYLDLLSNIHEQEKQQAYLDTLRRETVRLTNLIEDLLTISRLEAGRVELFVRPVDINRLIAELVNDRTIMANMRGLVLKCEEAENLPLAMADQRLLGQAISNLLTNAINYTPSGGTILLKSAYQDADGSQWVLVHVVDDGYGIDPEELNHIFERFFRGSASQQAKASGTGLGLPISMEIIERMGGRLRVESTPGKGSTFTVWLRAML
ncbi:MAG: GAF domain-containing protein [Omnitrophica WOR_2 bacterium]